VEHVELDGERINGDFIEMTDDGRRHMALFPPARSRNS